MAKASLNKPAQVALFLRLLRECGVAIEAARSTGISISTIYKWRRNDAVFAKAWEEALAAPRTGTAAKPRRASWSGWRTPFLEQLAQTSNVSASAAKAGVSVAKVYKRKQLEPAFASEFRSALYEGYEQLELEVLAYLRGHLTERKIDVANAVRQLATHRKTIAEMRALADDEDEHAILESINVMIERMRRNDEPDSSPDESDGSPDAAGATDSTDAANDHAG